MTRYQRERELDKRMGWGDDYAADAWRDVATGELLHVVVGHDPNLSPDEANKRWREQRLAEENARWRL